ncbi:MAG: glycosyltransferase [Rhodoferax sp.]
MSQTLFHVISGGTPGLRVDAQVVSAALTPYGCVSVHVSRQRNLHMPVTRFWLGLASAFGKRQHLGIFLENVPSTWLDVLTDSVIIPNQEWLRPATLQAMTRCSQVWCKTRYAEQIFQEHEFDAHFIGFSSVDRFLPQVAKNYGRFIHIAGRSELKGTQVVLDVWCRHPEWPTLVVVTRDRYLARYQSQNIRVMQHFVAEAALNILMNSAGVHVCPSEAEGFGHYINEALSTQAVVLTTDAPPMNELVDPAFGLLAKFKSRSVQGFGERFHVDPASLEERIELILDMKDEVKAAMGVLARKAFLAKRKSFEAAIVAAAAAWAGPRD